MHINKGLIRSIIFFLFTTLISSSDVYAVNKAVIYKQLNLQFDTKATTPLLSPPKVSAVIADSTDPAFVNGIYIDVLEDAAIINNLDYTVAIESNGNAIVKPSDVSVTKNTGIFLVKINPSGIGFCTINILVTYKKQTASIAIEYAASAKTDNNSFYHTGISDASAAILINDTTMLIGDDETNQLCMFHTSNSGLPIYTFNYEHFLSLTDGSPDNQKEVDVEACARSLKYPSSVYWIGSMSNGGKRFEVKDNRNTLFATYIKGTGKDLSIKCSDAYHKLRKYLIAWGDSYGYNFSASAESGQKPKQVGGFNVEGLTFGPDSTTLYICFRAPQVPLTSRNNALIAPLQNFESWFNEGKAKNKPVFGKPIEFNLDKRGIRDMIVLSDKSYLIVAGNADAVKNTALYKWTGFENDQPVLLNTQGIAGLGVEAAIELTENGKPTGKIQLICDDGSTEWYNDGNAAKNLDARYKKFRSIIVNIAGSH